MPRKLFLLAILAAITFISCDKDSAPAAEAILHGRWVKGDKTGDTLEFYSRAGVHYLMSNQSFNDDLYAPLEREYRFRNDQLTLIYRNGVDVLEVPAEGFTWKTRGQEFEINGAPIYMFLATIGTKYTFHKIH